jgi:hypothetical protein
MLFIHPTANLSLPPEIFTQNAHMRSNETEHLYKTAQTEAVALNVTFI